MLYLLYLYKSYFNQIRQMNIKLFYILGTLIAVGVVRIISNAMMNFQVLATIIFGTLGLIALIRSGNKALRGSGQNKIGEDSDEEENLVADPTFFSENADALTA